MKLVWTKESLTRLREIEEYIAADNPRAALAFIDKIISLADSLSENPEKGRIVPELSITQIREILYKNYRIVYLLRKNSIEILTVFEGHRLLRKDETSMKNHLHTKE
jgi:toxin ParE1/3/4